MTKCGLITALAACAAAAAVMNSPAMAGENTGNGKPTQGPAHANSICTFSGLNDDPDVAPFGRTQNYGHTMQFYDIVAKLFNPGDACNPNAEPPPV